ncbi:MAG: hypothetical protein KKH97_03635 [Proteobacteria bacterium]|nr:hypothetical protein [Pseudomonadota bacterium]
MHVNPQIRFFLSGQTQPLEPNSKQWNLPLPVKRETTGIKADQNPSLSVTYGDYFEAAGKFIIKNNYEVILKALSYMNEFIRLEQVNEIKISLEKHGPFYHPSKIEAVTENSAIPFVLNVAVSKIGIECIHKEFFTLKKLNSEFSNSFIPAVYGQDDFNGRDNLKIGMFLGEWFEGYSEFHISKDPSDGKEKILIWDNSNGSFFVSEDTAIEIYRQASRIMTCFYNVQTFEQIFPWHHAAGDFVVKQTGDSLDVKLITARQYASLFQTKVQTKDMDLVFEGLLMFLVVLSIRMRLDRINGTGDIVWAHNMSVDGTIEGFREGLEIKTRSGVIPYNFIDEFRIYLQSRSESELFELSESIINSFNQSAPDMPVIWRNLAKHSSELHHAVKNL